MFYRVTANLHFTEPDEANDFYHDCQVALPKSDTINPDTISIEKGHIEIHKCYHDEDPTKPCEVINEDSTP